MVGATGPVVCPKCGYARSANETAPTWQCPRCGIAYHKYPAYLAAARSRAQRLVVPPGAGDAAPPIALDGSVWALVGANAFALGVALWQGWGAAPLMLVYWCQNVAIGIANVLRILSLDRFSTENFTINNKPVQPTPAVKVQVALFFAVHYGGFHLGYLIFIASGREGAAIEWRWVALCALVFALDHLWSFLYNVELDRRGTPNIGTFMFMPYLRIVPMHLTILLGGMLFHGTLALVLFCALKTAADVAMHLVEHAQLQKVRAARAAAPPANSERARGT
jgi:hypothetical protein